MLLVPFCFVYIPLFSYICISTNGRKIGQIGCIYFTLITQACLLFSSMTVLYNAIGNNEHYLVHLGTWFSVGRLYVD